MSNQDMAPQPRSGGQILADQLAVLGARKMFCVPGESFLALLDGLYEHRGDIELISCRHESGAANMAEAYGKLTGLPGICAVTRGPGATNACNGVHTAFQDSTPMILLIGQVGRDMIEREAFQEMDYRRMFGEMAKWVAQIDDPARIPEYLSRAWHVALSGRPGPVVLALPEDMLVEMATVRDARPVSIAASAPTPEAMAEVADLLGRAERPMLVVGGAGWDADCARMALEFCETFDLPVATSFRRQDYVDNAHPNYAGVIGIAPSPALRKAIREETDLLIALGPRFGEMATQGYTLIDSPVPQMKMIHVHCGAEELGHVYAPDVSIASSPKAFLKAALALPTPGARRRAPGWTAKHHDGFLAYQQPTETPGDVNMARVIGHMTDTMPDDAVFTNGAGNYTVWLHRYHQHRRYGTQLAPTSGSMGYGVPAAIAAKLTFPEREVVAMAGDGCFLMTGQELATARQYGAAVIFIVVNNAMFGTIRMHQERTYPGRVISTDLINPDFVGYAKSFGIPGELVRADADFPAALARARASSAGYLIEIAIDPEALTPSQTLSAARAQGETLKAT